MIFGGRSVEHDVSIVSAHQVMAVLGERHTVVPIYITREGRWLTSPGLNDLQVYKDERWSEVGEEGFIPPSTGYQGLLVPGGRLKGSRRIELDVVVPMIHGTYGEDGTLQGLLELADVPYTCSGVVGSAAGMDKAVMKAAFKEAGLPVVPHVMVDSGRLDVDPAPVLDEVERGIGYPAFVKPARLGSSVGIGKATDRQTLTDALEVAARVRPQDPGGEGDGGMRRGQLLGSRGPRVRAPALGVRATGRVGGVPDLRRQVHERKQGGGRDVRGQGRTGDGLARPAYPRPHI